jgi:hypothetical protein
VFEGVTSTTSFSGPDCVLVTNSFFVDTSSSGSGGAISVEAVELIVLDTTFLRTQASSGGAIESNGPRLATSKCCFRETKAASGIAMYFPVVSSNEVSDSSFVGCGSSSSDGTGTGTIFLNLGSLTSQALNFSQCNLHPLANGNVALGAAIFANQTTAMFQLQYCTILECGGMSCLQSYSTTVQSVSFCNIYGNQMAGYFAVIAADTVGMNIDSCIFDKNTKEIFLYHPLSGGARFSLMSCVFSGEFPAGGYYDLATGNLAYTVTASYATVYFNTHFCPTSTPLRTPSPVQSVPMSSYSASASAVISPTDQPPAAGGESAGMYAGIGAGSVLAVVLAVVGVFMLVIKWKGRDGDGADYEVESARGQNPVFDSHDEFGDQYGAVSTVPTTDEVGHFGFTDVTAFPKE